MVQEIALETCGRGDVTVPLTCRHVWFGKTWMDSLLSGDEAEKDLKNVDRYVLPIALDDVVTYKGTD